MESIQLSLKPTFEQARLATIATAGIAKAFYREITGQTCPKDSQFINAVELSVGEACTNSIRHRSREKRGNVQVSFEFGSRELKVRIRDRNEPVDFDQFPAPDMENGQESGYGLHIMRSAMNNVSYERIDGWNIITLKKSIEHGVEQ